MWDNLFKGIFDAEYTQVISVSDFLICLGVSLVLGLMLAAAFSFRSRSTSGFFATLALLPAVVCVVIMMVNGNIGTGVAVAGAFSLVRFRSAQGSAREIGALFLAMGVGLIAGMGYLGYACLFALIMSLVSIAYAALAYGGRRAVESCRTLRITIPEDLDYTGAFDDIFEKCTDRCELTSVKTTDMGSLYKLTYELKMKRGASEKEMIDQLRCRNGNLEIAVSRRESTPVTEL